MTTPASVAQPAPSSLSPESEVLRITPLHALHKEQGARMVPFAGYDMPVQYPSGIIQEHLHTRTRAGLFDVSHMGQAVLRGANASAALESLVCGDMQGLKEGRQRYTLLMNAAGGIIDDLMVARHSGQGGEEHLFLVVNASRKQTDFAHIEAALKDVRLEILEERALLALQGPLAARILSDEIPQASSLAFMQSTPVRYRGADLILSRSGYTGEDGFEISIPSSMAEEFARTLLKNSDVAPVGLGARDSLRLEAGLCLYGHDIDETTSPVEAALNFALSKKRLITRDFPGAQRIVSELEAGPSRLRTGFRIQGRQPVREGETVFVQDRAVGRVTSGGYGPSVQAPIAMGYVDAAHARIGEEISFQVRNKTIPAQIAPLTFVQPNYHRKPL